MNPISPIDGSEAGGRVVSPWLAGLLLRRSDLAQRFTHAYEQLKHMPRPWQTRLRRKFATTLAGAALLLALAGPVAGPPALAEPESPEATITVVNGEVAIANNGKCSLMEAIINARARSTSGMKADCVLGNPTGADTINLPANGLFTLTQAHNEVFGPTGLPVITSDMTINGNGSTIRRDTANETPTFRLMAIDPGVDMNLHGLILENGGPSLLGNDYWGLRLPGGGILDHGNVSLENCTISGNEGTGGGGLYVNRGGTAYLNNSKVIENASFGYPRPTNGGGIWNRGQLTIVDSLIAYNMNASGDEYWGTGGGISNAGIATIYRSTISGNVVDGDSLEHQYGGYGGALSNYGTMSIINSTISNNDAWYGGGIQNWGDLTLVHDTVVSNSASHVGGIANIDPFGYGGSLTLVGTIISGNTSYFGAAEVAANPSVTANAFNIFGRSGNAGISGFTKGATDIVPSGALSTIVSPLADNGGPTLTHALPANSPAIDRAPNAQCTAAPVSGIDQRGEPRNQNGKDGVTANECDIGAFEKSAAAAQMGFYVSGQAGGRVGGVAFAAGDILKFTPGSGWSLYFDASDVKLPGNLNSFAINNDGHILMSFAGAVNVPGVGSIPPQDAVRFLPTATGPATAGSFQWHVDGSDVGLTTADEKIDALGTNAAQQVLISTTGTAAVNGTSLKAQDEDVILLKGSSYGANTVGTWELRLNGTAIPGLGVEDVNAVWRDPATGDWTIAIVGAFNLGGVKGDGKDIVKLKDNGDGTYTPSLFWDGSAAGFPTTIDGLEMAP